MATVVRIVEVILFRFRGDRPEILLLRRAPKERVYPGIWQVITGTILEEENAVSAARREIGEETGLVPERFWKIPYVGSFFDGEKDEMHLAPFFAAQVPPSSAPTLSDEHDAWIWVPVEEAMRMLPLLGQQEALRAMQSSILRDLSGGSLWAIP